MNCEWRREGLDWFQVVETTGRIGDEGGEKGGQRMTRKGRKGEGEGEGRWMED